MKQVKHSEKSVQAKDQELSDLKIDYVEVRFLLVLLPIGMPNVRRIPSRTRKSRRP
jgi:hypothetical protein